MLLKSSNFHRQPILCEYGISIANKAFLIKNLEL